MSKIKVFLANVNVYGELQFDAEDLVAEFSHVSWARNFINNNPKMGDSPIIWVVREGKSNTPLESDDFVWTNIYFNGKLVGWEFVNGTMYIPSKVAKQYWERRD